MKRDLDKTRAALIDAAEKLMSECDDPDEVTARAITKEAGVNLAMINYCFGSREELLYEVFTKLQQNAAALDPDIGRIISGDLSPKEKLAEAVGIVRDSKFIECTECGYCLDDCPVAIPIPRYFGLYNDVKQFGTTYFSNQSFIYKSYSQKNGVGKASDCTECESCVENCPQHLDIPRFMGDVREMFE